MRRVQIRVKGTVQGVGYRPFVFRLAHQLGLAGWVLNDTLGVLIEVEGTVPAVTRFVDLLTEEAPPLASVERIEPEELAPDGKTGFEIVASEASGELGAPVSPDSATCDDCLCELFDSEDRRYRYPFVNCTNCGPRFTIIEGVPYDRPLTTMSGFEMCGDCREEYENPLDRRFHAQPNACFVCGPRARLLGRGGEEVAATESGDVVAAAAAALGEGQILAVKGLGGYHFACRADDEGAVAMLRSRKHREDKPFAVMVSRIEQARALAEIGPEEELLLASRERPIVLTPRRPDVDLATAVALRSRELGLMLPYTPLHHLLLADCGTPLVMTSGNVSDEPIAYRDEQAIERLGSIADLFLVHDRPIHIRTDDSVVRSVSVGEPGAPMMLRRSRGFVPRSLELPVEASRPLLACGAELKNTFCLAKGRRAWVGHHIGDLENYETLRSFSEGIEHFQRLFAVEPALCAHDLHPDYLSTKYARQREGVELVAVQHHHAHLAACLAEHGEEGPALGVVFDGTGFGADGTIWGGELLIGTLRDFERAGHLRPVALPGGKAAIREPWRMACAWSIEALGAVPEVPAALASAVDARDWRNCGELVRRGIGSPTTTSMGRLFDAVGALCGAAARVSYEGQTAVELEAMAAAGEGGIYEMPLTAGEEGPGGPDVLDPRPVVRAVLADIGAGTAPALVAARFHNSIAVATVQSCVALAGRLGLEKVVLSGGVFQNRRLLEQAASLVRAAGLRVLVPERLPPNDGGISFGQAAVAAARSRA
ncbi:MAG TPA: carbamoyltransferase HypF [Solirubrobacterales bacterium]|nr:carbamoyltransferase HypF [Solirubrobacterales bacterium]